MWLKATNSGADPSAVKNWTSTSEGVTALTWEGNGVLKKNDASAFCSVLTIILLTNSSNKSKFFVVLNELYYYLVLAHIFTPATIYI